MVQFANGEIRLAQYDANLRQVWESKSITYDLWDNTASPVVYLNETKSGTGAAGQNDELIGCPLFHGGANASEILAMQFRHTAAMTPATASHVVRIPGIKTYRNGQGKIVNVEHTLTIRDRYTQSTASTNMHPNGLPDNTVTVANVWSDVLRFLFPGFNFLPKGRAYAVLDGA